MIRIKITLLIIRKDPFFTDKITVNSNVKNIGNKDP